jgi:hypothetical protein
VSNRKQKTRICKRKDAYSAEHRFLDPELLAKAAKTQLNSWSGLGVSNPMDLQLSLHSSEDEQNGANSFEGATMNHSQLLWAIPS